MKTIINARPFIGDSIHDTTTITIEDGIITAIGAQAKGEIIDAKDCIVAPGYIDIHTHGGFGKDCMEPTEQAIETICKYHLSTGITTFYPTTMTATYAEIDNALKNIRAYKSKYAKIAGVHVEGPFLAKKSAGAHPIELLKDLSDENTEFVFKNKDLIKRVTIAPNLYNAAPFTKKAVECGIQISLGHDDSIDDEIYSCIDAGAKSVTHMYNCTSRPSRRQTPKKHLGLTEVGLIDNRLMCEIIADDRHVPNTLFDMVLKLKTDNNICLVSDSLSVAGQKEGTYYLGSGESQQEILIEDGVAVLPRANTYAGSITPISKMASMLLEHGISVESCLKMAITNPAKLMGLKDRGNILPGFIADLNILDDNLNIVQTLVDGDIVKI